VLIKWISYLVTTNCQIDDKKKTSFRFSKYLNLLLPPPNLPSWLYTSFRFSKYLFSYTCIQLV